MEGAGLFLERGVLRKRRAVSAGPADLSGDGPGVPPAGGC